jgi:hypothetical protein
MRNKKSLMRKTICQLFFLILLMNVAGSQPYEAFVFHQNRYNKDVRIEKVVVGNGKTEVQMTIQSLNADIDIFLFPPESEQSIMLRTFEKTYTIRSADGIPFHPKRAPVAMNTAKSFSLYFDEIPDYVTEFDVIERVEPFDSGFSFFNVKLSGSRDLKKSLRFNDVSDFQHYFNSKPNRHQMEGFWTIRNERITTFKKKNKQPVELKFTDTIALVAEDGLLRAYQFNGEEYRIAIKELDNYFVLRSDIIESTLLLEVSDDRKAVKLFGLLDKSAVFKRKKEQRKIREMILRTIWKKLETP